MKVLKVVLIFLACLTGVSALAQSSELVNARVSFRTALSRDDFSEVERLHESLMTTSKKTSQGVFLADLHTDFSSLTECHHTLTKTSNIGSLNISLDGEQCRNSQEYRLNTWKKKFPNSQLPVVARSAIYLDKANTFNPVERASNILRENLLNDAITALNQVPPKTRQPIWYGMLMDIATAQGWGAKKFWILVNEATSKFPNNPMLYRKATLHFLPKNGGSSEEIEQLAQLATSNSMGTDGVGMYSQVYDEVILGSGGYWQTAYVKTRVSWQAMKSGLADIYQRYPDPWNLGRYAQHACLANDLSTLKTLLYQIEKSSLPNKEAGWGRGEFARCKSLAAR